MKKAIIGFTLLTLTACGGLNPNTIEVSTKPNRLTASEVKFVQSVVAEQSREPEAVRFRNLYSFVTSAGDTIVCGEVNAKNAYGGYVGYRPMWVRFKGTEVKSVLWDENYAASNAASCAEAKLGKAMVSS